MSNSNSLQNQSLYTFSVFCLDTNDGLFVEKESVKLAPKVFQTLVFFVENQGRVITKDELFEKIWADTFVEDNALSFNISQLRKALAKYDSQTVFIETIPKRGFRFNEIVKEAVKDEETEIIYEKYQTQEIVIEETKQEVLKKQLEKRQTKYFSKIVATFAIVGIVTVCGFAFWQWQKNKEMRSFDSLKIVKLTSWKSKGSNVFSKYDVSNNGKFIAFSTIKDKTEQVFVKQMNSGEDINITKDNWHNFNPIWSPDDQQIAFASIRENQIGIYISPSLGGNSVLLKLIDKSQISLLKWSKDGLGIFCEIEGNLFKIDINNKEILQITNLLESSEERKFAVSADEKKVAFCENYEGQIDILSMDLQTKETFQVTNNKDIESNLIWHSSGNKIIYEVLQNEHHQINIVYTNGSEPLQITRGDDEYQLLDISNDGEKIFYRTWEEKSDIWAINIVNKKEFEIAKENDSEFWSDVSPNGKRISYQKNSTPHAIANLYDSSIVISDFSDVKSQVSVKGTNQKWLPDNTKLSFLRWEEKSQINNLWILNTVSGEENQITTNGIGDSGFAVMPYNRYQIADFSWSDDGKKVISIDSMMQNVWLTLIDSKETINLSNNDNPKRTFNCPIWSKDNKKIFFTSVIRPVNTSEKVVWSIWSVENQIAKEEFSSQEPLRLLGWSEVNNELLCLSTNDVIKAGPIDVKLIRIATTSGESKIVDTFEKISALSVTLSSDGKKIAFTKREQYKENIYIMSLKNLETIQITNNTDSDILFGSLNWSPDNTKLFFDKQEKINMISIIENFK